MYRRRLIVELSKVGLTIVVMLLSLSVAMEGVLRLLGFTPRASSVRSDPEGEHGAVSAMHLRDETLGWRNKPGSYRYFDLAREVEKTILADGSRVTPVSSEATRTALLIGDSFTAGAGLSDRETMAWKLQTLLPGWRIKNYGVGGYGSCQSWAALRVQLDSPDAEGATVIYGFNHFHEGRNVAFPSWDYFLAIGAEAGHVSYPFCELDRDAHPLLRPPRRYALRFPGAERSAFITFLERGYLAWLTRPLVSMSRAVTERLLIEMRDEVAKRHGRFLVLFMTAPEPFRDHYRRFFEEQGIDYLNGSDRVNDPEMKLSDNHPNAAMNELWATQLAEKISHHPLPG